jgi:hypothetical protein
MTVKGFPELRFDTGGNAAISMAVLGEYARRGDVKIKDEGLDPTGRLVLRIALPGSKTVVPRREFRR